jgi:hypothetical protein
VQLSTGVKLEPRLVANNLLASIRQRLAHITHNWPVLVVNLGGEWNIWIPTIFEQLARLLLRALGG